MDGMAERMSTSLMFEWAEWFQMEHEAEKKALEKAKSKSRRR